MEIADKISINSSPDRVYNALIFFFQNSESYKLWHPDHISCYWKKGEDFSSGSVLIAKEYLHGKPHKLGFIITNYKQDCLFEYKTLFPFSIICPGGDFEIVPKGKETEFVAKLNFRGGKLLKMMFKNNIEQLEKHMKEEGENLKKFVESF